MKAVTKQLLIAGRVQGVGFRAHAKQVASQYGLRGWVRNLTDGRVEVRIQGEVDRVDEAISRIAEGPSMSRVDSMIVDEPNTDEELGPFSIRQ